MLTSLRAQQSVELAVPRTRGDWTGSPLHPNFPPNWSVKGRSLCTPALSHLLPRPRETAWLPNGGMACSWPEHEGAGGRQRRALERLKTKQKKRASVKVCFFSFRGVVVCLWFWRSIPRPPPQEWTSLQRPPVSSGPAIAVMSGWPLVLLKVLHNPFVPPLRCQK